MEVRIGVVESQKEISVEVPSDGAAVEELVAAVERAVAGEVPVLWLTDEDGRRVGVAAAKVTYVELVVENESHRVGFGKE